MQQNEVNRRLVGAARKGAERMKALEERIDEQQQQLDALARENGKLMIALTQLMRATLKEDHPARVDLLELVGSAAVETD